MRDYAKRNSPVVIQQKPSDGSEILIFLAICTILFVGYVIYHFTHHSASTPKPKATHAASIATPKKIAKKPIAIKIAHPKIVKHHHEKKIAAKKSKPHDTIALNPADIQPKYDFYTLLPETTVKVPTVSTPSLTPPASSAKATQHHYVLEMGSMQNKKTAHQASSGFKAAGYPSFVKSYQAPDHSTWYHVMIGPFNQLKTAQAEQNKLYAHHMSAMLLQ
jgi:cell division protein FtsN